VAALIWDRQRETAVLEFFSSFARAGLDIAPLIMPLADLQRGERIFSFPSLSLKTFQGLPGLIADSLPDDYGNSVIDEWFSRRGLSVQITPVDRLMYIGKRGMGHHRTQRNHERAAIGPGESAKRIHLLVDEI